jgi:small subunit ribosomal protein S15
MPGELGYGVRDAEKKLLFEHLPLATLHMTSQVHKPSFTKEMRDEDEEAELRKANLLAKALDLRNANAAGIAYENRKRIIEAFSTPENPFDSGRTEVQGKSCSFSSRFDLIPFSCTVDIQNPQSMEAPHQLQARCRQPTESAETRPPAC